MNDHNRKFKTSQLKQRTNKEELHVLASDPELITNFSGEQIVQEESNPLNMDFRNHYNLRKVEKVIYFKKLSSKIEDCPFSQNCQAMPLHTHTHTHKLPARHKNTK